MQIAEFFASLKIKPDMASIARADRWLKTMEKRINRSAKRMEKNNVLGTAFSTDTKKLNKQLQRSLDRLSKTLVLRITRFHINERGLERALGTAMQRSNTPLPIRRFRIDAASLRRSLELAMAGISPTVRPRVVNRPQAVPGSPAPRGNTLLPSRGGGSGRFRITPSGVGIAAGGVGVFGGFGIAALNRTVRELESLPVALEAVTGSPERARDELEYLNRLGNEVGAPVRTMAPEYTKFLASAMGTPLEDSSQSSYRNILRYSRTIGMDNEAVKGTLKAITQIANKQRVYAEELVGQLGERAPAAIRMMADAIAGGDTKKLFQMMEQGAIDPNTALPALAAQMGMVADRGWNSYTQTIGYQQNQTTKRFEDFIKLFMGAGGGEGFFRIWKAFADTLPRLENIAMALGRAFNVFGEGVQRAGDILVMFNDAIGWFNKQSPTFQTSLGTLGAAFLLLGTKIGRAFLPLTMAFLILEDIASYNQGRKSITGLAFGEDYGPKAPGTIQAPNPYKGMLGGRHINNLEKSGGFFNNTMAHMLKSPMVQYNPIFKANQWAAEALFIPNYETTTLTPQAAMDATINNLSGFNGLDKTGNGRTVNIERVEINATTDSPEEMADRFIKRIDLDAASAQFPVGEGGG